MKKSIKVLALIAAMAASMTCFASCNKGGGNGNTPTLKWLLIGGQPNDLQMVTDEMNKYSEEKIGVKCEYTYIDWGPWSDRITAILNSGEPFDIMFNDSGKYYNAINLGRFAELDDLLKDVPQLTELVPQGVWDGVKVNGKIYGVPTYKDSAQTQYWCWDKKYVDKYNIDITKIHTLKEMEPAIETLQNAINNGEITITDYAFSLPNGGINGQFMNYDGNFAGLGVRYDDPTGTVVRVLEQPELMEQYEYLHKWYEAGIINPDAPTTAEQSNKALVGSAQGFPTAEIGWGVDKEEGAVIEPWGGPVFSNGTILGSINSISSSSQYKAEALKYLELVNCDPVMRNMLAFGIEGTHYVMNDDGRITRDPVKKDDYGPATYAQATFFTIYPQDTEPADKWDQVKAWVDTAESSVLLGFVFDRSSVENELAACDAAGTAFTSNIFTGAVDPHTAIPEYYAALEQAGMNKVQEELQKQINEFLGK